MPATPTTGRRDFSRRTNYDFFSNHIPYDNRVHYAPMYENNTWPSHSIIPPPPPAAHQVWILDCKFCGMFLTNRGMKAVLLLHSSDALPINCSAYSPNPGGSRPRTLCLRPDIPNRTCECLTQTLCCHGCGTAVGYMIVIPCNRCTKSVTTTNRTANGHRFIFHSNEVVGMERHYVPYEPGVISCETFEDLPAPDPFRHPTNSQMVPYGIMQEDAAPRIAIGFSQTGYSYSRPPSRQDAMSSDSAEVKETRLACRLKAGDILFWHHLSRHGEIPGVADDPQARKRFTTVPLPRPTMDR